MSGRNRTGRGHETVYAQFLSDQTGIPADRIRVVQGDSDRLAQGGGTGGSRSVTVQSAATLVTIDQMIAAFTPYLADKLGVEESDVTFDHETFRAPGSNLTPARMAAPTCCSTRPARGSRRAAIPTAPMLPRS